MKKALITGITGQDGSYLAEFLLRKNYEVYGMYRPGSRTIFERYPYNIEGINFIEGDLTDDSSLARVIQKTHPDEIYNLGAQSSTGSSNPNPLLTFDINTLGVVKLIEKTRSWNPQIKIYQAGSSELFGFTNQSPQNEQTLFNPRNAYGISKLAAYYFVVNARNKDGLFACNGITYNHESPRRGMGFVTRKITSGLTKIKKGQMEKIFLGNLDAKRDWGFAGDYVEAMWLMMQQPGGNDYILATGETHSVRDFVTKTAENLDMDIEWKGSNINEVGINKDNGRIIVEVCKEFYSPEEKNILCGDISKLKNIGWNPKTSFDELIEMMVEEDLSLCE